MKPHLSRAMRFVAGVLCLSGGWSLAVNANPPMNGRTLLGIYLAVIGAFLVTSTRPPKQ